MTDHTNRIGRLQRALSAAGAEALLVTDLTNVRYLTGFSGTNGQVLVAPDLVTFFTDPRYEARAQLLVKGAEVSIYQGRLVETLKPVLESTGITRLAVEARATTLAERDDLIERLGGIDIVGIKDTVEGLRRAKDESEVAAIREAVELTDRAFDWVLDRLKPGAIERDVALDLEVFMRREGAEAVAFEPIVGSGPLSAHIHHTPSDRAFERGDLVLIDMGCRREGYCSDLTRTVVLGPAADSQTEMYATVLAAQEAGIDAVKAGASGRDVDAAARAIIDAAGSADRFGHGLGHGVGLDVHEGPRLSRISEDILATGDVVTIEPGVYEPDVGGIRIEDCVLVQADSGEVLGSAPKKELIEL